MSEQLTVAEVTNALHGMMAKGMDLTPEEHDRNQVLGKAIHEVQTYKDKQRMAEVRRRQVEPAQLVVRDMENIRATSPACLASGAQCRCPLCRAWMDNIPDGERFLVKCPDCGWSTLTDAPPHGEGEGAAIPSGQKLADYMDKQFEPEAVRASQAEFYEDALKAQMARAEKAEHRAEHAEERWKFWMDTCEDNQDTIADLMGQGKPPMEYMDPPALPDSVKRYTQALEEFRDDMGASKPPAQGGEGQEGGA